MRTHMQAQPQLPRAPLPPPAAPRLKASMLDRILKWLMIMAASEGVGQNSEQLVTAAGRLGKDWWVG